MSPVLLVLNEICMTGRLQMPQVHPRIILELCCDGTSRQKQVTTVKLWGTYATCTQNAKDQRKVGGQPYMWIEGGKRGGGSN